MGIQRERPLVEHLAELKAVGYTIFRGHLDPATVVALRDVLEPIFTTAFAAGVALLSACVRAHARARVCVM